MKSDSQVGDQMDVGGYGGGEKYLLVFKGPE